MFALFGCVSLRFIRLPRTLVHIGTAAFLDCKSLEIDYYLPPTVKYIGGQAFNNCASLRSFHVPEPIAHIGNRGRVLDGCNFILHEYKEEDQEEDDEY